MDQAVAGIGQSHLIKTRMSPVPGLGALEIRFYNHVSRSGFNPERIV